MTEKRQTLKGYIIRILQHFATNIFVQTCLDQNFTQKGERSIHVSTSSLFDHDSMEPKGIAVRNY
jgi:hypothetical protein